MADLARVLMGNKLAQAGRRNRRVTIVRGGVAMRDARGDMVPGAATSWTRWASVTPVPGTERFANGEMAATAPKRFVFGYRAGLVRVTDRLTFEGKSYDVKSVDEVGFREAIEVLAVSRAE